LGGCRYEGVLPVGGRFMSVGKVGLKRALLGASVGAIVLGTAGAGQAQQIFGSVPYVAFGGGFNFASDPTVTGLQDLGTELGPYPLSVAKQSGLDVGGVGLIALGLDFKNGWRAELEGSYRKNTGARFNVQAEGSSIVGVDRRTYALMANIWRDFMLVDRLSFHVGGGLGVADHKMNVTDNFGTNIAIKKTEGAYQAGAGFAYQLIPGLKATIDYRLFGLFDRPSGNVTVLTSCSNGACGSLPASNERVLLNVKSGAIDQSVIFGLIWAFGS
jgi:OmpA-OmpF porin, OOP family